MTGLTTAQLSTMFGVLAGTAAIVGAIAIFDALTTSYKEAAKASDDAAQAFEDSANKVSGIQKELQDVKDKIDEINKQDKISPTDDANLQKLKTQKELLERDLAIEQKLYKLRQKQNAEKAADAIAKGGSDSIDWRHQTDNDLSRLGVTDADRKSAGWEYDPRPGASRWEYDLAQETAAMQSAYNRYVQQQNELKQQLADNGSLTKEQEKQKKQIDEYTQKLEEAIGQNVEELQTYRERLTNGAGQALKGHEDQVFQIDQVLDQFSGIERDPFEDLANHWKELQRLSKTDAGMQTAEMRHFLEVMSGKDLSTAGLEELQKIWDKFKNLQTVDFSKMFTGDTQTNLQNFWQMVEKVNSEWAEFDEKTQTWKFNIDSVEELAQKLGVSEDLVKNIIKLTNEAGAKIEVQNKDLNGQKVMDSSKAEKTLKKAGVIDKKYNVNLETDDYLQLNKQINDISANLDKLRSKDGKINIDSKEGQAAYSLISQLYDKMIELSNKNNIAFHLNTEEIGEGGTKAQETARSLHDASVAIAEYQAALNKSEYNPKINVEEFEKKAKSACDKAAADLKAVEETDPKLAEKLTISSDQLDFSAITTALGNAVDPNIVFGQIQQSIAGMTQDDFTVVLGVEPEAIENYVAEEKETPVQLKVDDSALKTVVDKTYDVSTKIKVTDKSALTGLTTTVSATLKPFRSPLFGEQGFQGNAHAGGKWGTQRDEVALTSELGPEIVVDPKTGRWQTVGDKGAQFTRLPKGAIIFNHKQTEQLLKYGHINSRGKALVGGNAYPTGVQGTWNVGGTNDSGNGSKEQQDAARETTKTAKEVAKNVKDSTDASKSAADTLKEETSNLTDWVEKVLENIEKKTEKYLAKAEKKAEAGNYSGAAKQYQKALNTYDKSIGKHGDAENLYMRQANSALSKAISSGTITKEMAATIQKRVANGAMKISGLSEGTKAVVDAYKEYYDKAVAAQEATQELYDKYEETAKKMYQLPLDQASAKTDKLKNSYEILEKKLDATTNATKQEALMEQQIANLRKQQAAASKAYDSAKSNYKGNKTKVNETTDKALSGLTDTMKAKVIAKVRENMVIDVTALTGLTAEGKQAIMDYNASLVAQQDALQNLQVVNLDTAASVKELAASIADLPNAKAEKKIEKQDDVIAELDAAYAIAKTPAEQEKILGKLTRRAEKKYEARVGATHGAQGNLDDIWEHNEFLRDRAERFGKQKGQKLSLKGLAEDSEEYELVAQYNAYIDALKKAEHNEKLAYSEYIQTKNANAEKLFENLQSSQSEDIKKVEQAVENAQHIVDNIDEAATKLMQVNTGMTYAEAVEQAYGDAEATFRDAGQKYEYFANILKEWLAAHEGELTPEQIGTIRGAIDGLYTDGTNAYASADAAALANRQFADQGAQRDLAIAQQHYDEIHQTNEKDKASGYNITPGAAETEKQALQELIDKNDALTQSLYAQRSAVKAGSEEWNRLNNEYNDSFNSGISLRNSMTDLNEEIQDIKFKPLNDQLEDLQNEADKTKDHMTFMQNLGMQPLVSDYVKLIQNSRQQVDLLKQQRAEMQAQLQSGTLTEQEYARIKQQVAECDAQIRQAENDQAGWKKSAQDTVINSISSVGNAMSSGANAVSQVTDKIVEMLKKIQQAMIDFRKRQINKIYRTLKRIDTKISTIQNKIAIQQELGQKVSADDYAQQASQLAAKIKQYDTELIPKLRQEYNIQKRHQHSNPDYDVMADPDGSKTKAAYEEWQSAVTELENLRLELIKLLNSDLSSVLLEPLESAKKYLSDINGLLGSVSKLITDDMLFDVDSNKTEQYTQKMAILAGQYRTVQEEVQATKNEIWGLSAYLASAQKAPDSFMEDYLDKWGELADVAESQKQIALEMVDAMREASEEEVNHLQKIIDARREALQSKKDYYEYDKTIRNKSKDIQALQAQIAALEGLADAESKAKRARLEADLATAQEDLDDTIQQHMFDLSDKALEDLGDALEKSHEEQWEKLVSSVDELLKYAAEFSSYYSDSDVSDSLESILRSYGIITGETSKQDETMISTLFRRMLSEANTGAYNKQTFDETINGYNNAVEDLKKQGLLTDIAKIATDTEALVQAVEDRVNEESPQTSTNPEGKRSFYDQLKALFAGNSINGEQGGNPNALGELVVLPQTIALDFMEWTSGTKMEDWFWGGAEGREQREDEIAKSALDLLDRLKNVKIGNWNVFGKYATGSRRVGKNKLAWTQEGGKEEWIVRPSDGAILTPLSPDSGVLPPDITSKLWALADGKMPTMQMPKMPTPNFDFSETISPVVNIDNSMTVEGSVDAAVISDLKKFRDDMCEDAYRYTSEKMYRGYIHSGGKRRL